MATTNIKLPAIPDLDNETYKYYFILDRGSDFLLYLFENKPNSYIDEGEIHFTDKYGNYIYCLGYVYDRFSGQKDWRGSYSFEQYLSYDYFTDTLLYHNFTIDLGHVVFEENPMPVSAELDPNKPDFPELPNEGIITYKHYCVTDDKEDENLYHLYLFESEPAELKIGIYDLIEATDKFGNRVECRYYTYLIGMDIWELKNYRMYAFPLNSELSNPITYNNFDITFEQKVYAKNPLPNDEMIIPDLADFFAQDTKS